MSRGNPGPEAENPAKNSPVASISPMGMAMLSTINAVSNTAAAASSFLNLAARLSFPPIITLIFVVFFSPEGGVFPFFSDFNFADIFFIGCFDRVFPADLRCRR